MMSKEAKKNYVEEMKKNFNDNESVMIAQYQGLNVNELDELRNLLDDMLETMYAASGIGLAAVQVGVLKRLIVIDISKESLSIMGSDAKELKTNQNKTTIMKPSLSLRSVLA